MGVPAFFRWLSKRYPLIVVQCKEEKAVILEGVKIPLDISKSNPNGFEFDNFYLDMNGIIHPCCHPENKPAPNTEDEMMEAIFEYVDRLVNIVRPRRVLYMAIDGVAPRAKMNQQRSRRFRASKESKEHRETIAKIKEELQSKGAVIPPEKPDKEHFDSNCITPGTEFMSRLAECLRYYINMKMNTDPYWSQLTVILSDANVPGEGEHKIMDFIRRQRAQPQHDPNTRHCLCGADADLIMLGLATHEPNFTIIREEFKYHERHCEICGQKNHKMTECTGLPKEKQGEFDEKEPLISSEVEFIFLRLNILREYLYKQLQFDDLPFKQDIESSIDDWVLLCFFVGNDFLPHLPSLEIKEGAIDKLVNLYERVIRKCGGYLSDSGSVHLDRLELLLSYLGEIEDRIFKNRRDNDLKSKQIFEDRKKQKLLQGNLPYMIPLGKGIIPQIESAQSLKDRKRKAEECNSSQMFEDEEINTKRIRLDKNEIKSEVNQFNNPNLISDTDRISLDATKEDEIPDDVRLWEEGWKERYYKCKFGMGPENLDNFRFTVAKEYAISICWVLKYYYQGCSSWDWFFPFHYAPFASDMIKIKDLEVKFDGSKPLKPLEQLMAVFPAASSKFLPPSWQQLMIREDSEIIDFYPNDFKIDLNGKRQAWQGVALLPFVHRDRLLKTLETVYSNLTEDERIKNSLGHDLLFIHKNHMAFNFVESLYKRENNESTELDAALMHGMAGLISCDNRVIPVDEVVKSPLSRMHDCLKNETIFVRFNDPQFPSDLIFPSGLLPNATIPEPILKPEDFEQINKFKNSRNRNDANKHHHFRRMPNDNNTSRHRPDDRRNRYHNDEHGHRRDHGQKFQSSFGQNNFGHRQYSDRSGNQRHGYENNNYYQNQREDHRPHFHNETNQQYQRRDNRSGFPDQFDHRRNDRYHSGNQYEQRNEHGQYYTNQRQNRDIHGSDFQNSYDYRRDNRDPRLDSYNRDNILNTQYQPNQQYEQEDNRRVQYQRDNHSNLHTNPHQQRHNKTQRFNPHSRPH